MAPNATARPSRALEGEDLKTSDWEDARHWMSTRLLAGIPTHL